MGTRPEAIKLAPVIKAPRVSGGDFLVRVITSGQHGEICRSALAAFGLTADSELDVEPISGSLADAAGNLRFRRSQRNFNPIMAMAARVTVVEVEEEILPVGAIDPDDVHTAGIFVHRLVKIPPPPEGWWPQPPGSVGR